MAPLPEHLAGDNLFIPDEGTRVPDSKDEPAKEPAEKPAETKPEKQPEPEIEDADDEVDELSADELEEMIERRAEEKAAAKRPKDDEETLDDLLMDPKDREIAQLKARLAEKETKETQSAEAAQLDKADHEMKSCVGKYKMTEKERDAVILWFEQNPDLEGHPDWGFERAALRVNPDLRSRITAPHERTEEGDGFGPNGSARVINRGAAGGSPPQAPKYVPKRGSYGDVSAHVLRSGRGAGFFSREGR